MALQVNSSNTVKQAKTSVAKQAAEQRSEKKESNEPSVWSPQSRDASPRVVKPLAWNSETMKQLRAFAEDPRVSDYEVFQFYRRAKDLKSFEHYGAEVRRVASDSRVHASPAFKRLAKELDEAVRTHVETRKLTAYEQALSTSVGNAIGRARAKGVSSERVRDIVDHQVSTTLGPIVE